MDYSYIIITPARNVEKKIEKTIMSVISQTKRPAQWVIVNDSSTDNTREIIEKYAAQHDFIRIINRQSNNEVCFSSKVAAFNEGFTAIGSLHYEFICNLDGDVSFEPDYFEKLIRHFEEDEKLGLAGGLVYELHRGKMKPLGTSLWSVSGATQFFRRRCFEEIGGYVPIKIGGVDSAAEISVRAKGWLTKTFPQYQVVHHGKMLSGSRHAIKTKFNLGVCNYQLGYHPLFQLASCIFKMHNTPYLIGSFSTALGYCIAAIKGNKKVLDAETIEFFRKEQMGRLRTVIKQLIKGKRNIPKINNIRSDGF